MFYKILYLKILKDDDKSWCTHMNNVRLVLRKGDGNGEMQEKRSTRNVINKSAQCNLALSLKYFISTYLSFIFESVGSSVYVHVHVHVQTVERYKKEQASRKKDRTEKLICCLQCSIEKLTNRFNVHRRLTLSFCHSNSTRCVCVLFSPLFL